MCHMHFAGFYGDLPRYSAGSGKSYRVEAMLHDAAHDITAFAAFPVGHCKRIWPADPWSG